MGTDNRIKIDQNIEKDQAPFSDIGKNVPLQEEEFILRMIVFFEKRYSAREPIDKQFVLDCVSKAACISKHLYEYMLGTRMILNSLFENKIDIEIDKGIEINLGPKNFLTIIILDNLNELLLFSGCTRKEFSEKMEETLEVLLSESYVVPEEGDDIICHLIVAALVYASMVDFKNYISMKDKNKLDLACFYLVWEAGWRVGTNGQMINKARHARGVKEGKKKQKEITFNQILNCYKSLGAKWGDGVKKPIILNEQNVSINKLVEEISKTLRGVTQRHISNCLKELHGKGEI